MGQCGQGRAQGKGGVLAQTLRAREQGWGGRDHGRYRARLCKAVWKGTLDQEDMATP